MISLLKAIRKYFLRPFWNGARIAFNAVTGWVPSLSHKEQDLRWQETLQARSRSTIGNDLSPSLPKQRHLVLIVQNSHPRITGRMMSEQELSSFGGGGVCPREISSGLLKKLLNTSTPFSEILLDYELEQMYPTGFTTPVASIPPSFRRTTISNTHSPIPMVITGTS